MSLFTNHGENQLVDWTRGQGLTLPTNWHLTFGSAYSDAAPTEITGIGLSRISVARSLANWSGTQGAGTTLASSGTSHRTSNNGTIAMGTASGGATATHVLFFDASSGGNCWHAYELESPLVISASDAPSFAAGTILLEFGLSGGMSDYLANKLIDLYMRAQAFTYPATTYQRLYTVAPNAAGGGTEVGGGVGYSRPSITSTLAAWSGTQSAGSTTASSGTGGRSSNNAAIQFTGKTGAWGTVVATGNGDASSAGNLLWYGNLTSSKTITAAGPTPQFAANAFGRTFA